MPCSSLFYDSGYIKNGLLRKLVGFHSLFSSLFLLMNGDMLGITLLPWVYLILQSTLVTSLTVNQIRFNLKEAPLVSTLHNSTNFNQISGPYAFTTTNSLLPNLSDSQRMGFPISTPIYQSHHLHPLSSSSDAVPLSDFTPPFTMTPTPFRPNFVEINLDSPMDPEAVHTRNDERVCSSMYKFQPSQYPTLSSS
jgi:hypothetical protein